MKVGIQKMKTIISKIDINNIDKNELKKQKIEIINNKSYIERKIPSEKWQRKYDIKVFESSYISMIK